MTTTELIMALLITFALGVLGGAAAPCRHVNREHRQHLAAIRAELAAITERTLARTRARSDASRRGWATRQGRQTGNPDPVCADCGADLDGEGRCKQGCGTTKEETTC